MCFFQAENVMRCVGRSRGVGNAYKGRLVKWYLSGPIPLPSGIARGRYHCHVATPTPDTTSKWYPQGPIPLPRGIARGRYHFQVVSPGADTTATSHRQLPIPLPSGIARGRYHFQGGSPGVDDASKSGPYTHPKLPTSREEYYSCDILLFLINR